MSERQTKAILLAAGLGTRLRPLTDRVPKCLLPIGGRPLLQVWLDAIESAGVSEVLINTHWLADQVDAFVADCRTSLKIRTYFEPELLGSAGTIVANRQWSESADELLILYADNLTTVDLGGVLKFHRSHELPFTLGVFRADNPQRCGIVQVDGAGTVLGFVEKPEKPKSDLAAGGIYVASPQLVCEWSLLADGRRPFDLGLHVLPVMADSGRMKAFSLEGILVDIGTPESYARAQSLYLKERQ